MTNERHAGHLPPSAIGAGEQIHSEYRDLSLLTADDVCALLRVKKSWLYDTVEAGAIEVIRLGRQLRFRPSAISAYLAGRARADGRDWDGGKGLVRD
jgi:excisionase family DNA binding protein